MNVMCQDVLFVYTRGYTGGEEMPDGYGIKANPADEDGNRHFMLLTVYAEAFDGQFSDRSGVTAYTADGDADLHEAGKLLVGHQVSSKMVVLPAKGWAVQGVCHSGCTGAGGVTDQAKVHSRCQSYWSTIQ